VKDRYPRRGPRQLRPERPIQTPSQWPLHIMPHHYSRAKFFKLGPGKQIVIEQLPGTIHVLVSDVKRLRIDGIALRRQLLLEHPTTKVLLMSGVMDQPIERVPFLRSTSRKRSSASENCSRQGQHVRRNNFSLDRGEFLRLPRQSAFHVFARSRECGCVAIGRNQQYRDSYLVEHLAGMPMAHGEPACDDRGRVS
jgi:hypothetical protein